MVTNNRSYMRDYMRRIRKPYKRVAIMDKLVAMGFLEQWGEVYWKWLHFND